MRWYIWRVRGVPPPLQVGMSFLVLNAFGIGFWSLVLKPKISEINKYYSLGSILFCGWLDNKDACIRIPKRCFTCRPRAVTVIIQVVFQFWMSKGCTVRNRNPLLQLMRPQAWFRSGSWPCWRTAPYLCRFSLGPHHSNVIFLEVHGNLIDCHGCRFCVRPITESFWWAERNIKPTLKQYPLVAM